jgi:hypothetical protein
LAADEDQGLGHGLDRGRDPGSCMTCPVPRTRIPIILGDFLLTLPQ